MSIYLCLGGSRGTHKRSFNGQVTHVMEEKVARATPVAGLQGKWAVVVRGVVSYDHVTSCLFRSFQWSRVVALLLAGNMAEGGRKEEEINPLFGERCLDDPEEVFQQNSWFLSLPTLVLYTLHVFQFIGII